MLHQIGVGVLGPVFRAYQPDPGRLVAVKQFRLDLPPENAHRFVAALERLIAADLTHLGIAAPLAAGLTDNAPYLALDFVAAESFDVVIRDYGPAPVTEALRIATQLGGALDFAAAVHVFHGTLHPRDVLVSTADTRVTGLGIAQALEQLGVVPPVRRPYTAPERLAGAAWDRRADVFSLAALVFEMLFGRRIAGVGEQAAEAVTPVDDADAGALRALFARALAEDPSARFDTALAFADALQAAFTRPPRGARPAGARRRRDDTPVAPASLPLEPDHDLPLMLDAGDDPPALRLDADAVDAAASAPAQDSSTPTESEPLAEHDVLRESSHPPLTAGAPVDDLVMAADDPHGVAGLGASLDSRFTPAHEAPLAPLVLGPTDLADEPPDVLIPRSEAAQTSHGSFSTLALEESRSAIWPIVLALLVGVLVGFAAGYGVATRDRPVVPGRVTTAADASAPAASAAGTPVTPADSPRATAPVVAPAAPPAARPSTAPPASPPTAAPGPSASAAAPPAPRASAARATSDTGRLLVRSSPAGARVVVDGRDVGQTPLTVNDLSRGTHVVRIAHQGYVTAERRVRIRSTQTAQSIEVDLVATRPVRQAAAPPAAPERTGGSLMVDSRPSGARVFVDGKLVGTTPLLLDAVSAGEHAVRLELGGFSGWSTTARVGGGERVRVSGSLEQR